MNYFQMGTQIISGNGALKALKEIQMTSVLIICDPYMVESGKVADVTSLLAEREIDVTVFSEIIPDPTIEIQFDSLKSVSVEFGKTPRIVR